MALYPRFAFAVSAVSFWLTVFIGAFWGATFLVPDLELFADQQIRPWCSISTVFLCSFTIWIVIVLERPYFRIQGSGDLEREYMPNARYWPRGSAPRRRRRLGDLPPPFPNAWYRIMAHGELKVGEVKFVNCVGQQMVLFRGTDGVVRATDAYCPHLGANLSFGGTVEKERCIRCPFHGWEFDGDTGKCVHVPYIPGQKPDAQPCLPEISSIRAFPVKETNGMIMVWVDAERRPPLWQPESNPEIDRGSWRFQCYSEHVIHCHIQEIPENGIDVAHLKVLHLPSTVPVDCPRSSNPLIRWVGRAIEHRFTAEWNPCEPPDEHKVVIPIHEEFVVFGYTIQAFSMTVIVTQIGPSMVQISFSLPIGRLAIWETILPVGPVEQRLVHELWSDWWIPRWLCKIIMRMTLTQFERDVPIWDNKTYVSKPVTVRGDGNFSQYRRWFSKFYSENSAKMGNVHSLDW